MTARKIKTMQSKKNKERLGSIIRYIILTLMALIILIPILWMISTAVKNDVETFTSKPTWIPKEPTFKAFNKFWGLYNFGLLTMNSLFTVSASMIICVFCSCLAGYGVTRFEFKGRRQFMGFLLLTQMFPGVMLIVPFYAVLRTYGLINTYGALIVTYTATHIAFSTWMMSSFFKTIPVELDEAAVIDGANRFQTFLRIIIPLTLPGIASVSIFCFISCWNDYMFSYILVSSDKLKTLTVGIVALNSQLQVYWNDMMAASLYSSLPLMIIFICFQRYFIAGLTGGAVKS